MIKNLIILNFVFAALLKPGIPVQDTYYPSGNKEADKSYSSNKPATDSPLLNIDISAYDPEFNKLEAGIYSVEYSSMFNTLMISDGKKIIKAPVFQVIKLNQKVHLPSVETAFIKDNKVFIIFKKGNLEVHGFLYLPEAVLYKN